MANVGDVLHTSHLMTTDADEPRDEVAEEKGAQITHVGIAINRWTAAIEAKSSPIADRDFALLSALSVVKEDAGADRGARNDLPERDSGGIEGDDLSILLPNLIGSHKVTQEIPKSALRIVKADTDALAYLGDRR